ncbi:ScbR family autoregulator-binding transcription factor [Streptomyces sp. NPDC051577]|uniref:ScbR family autoregulator-binding transcription factor n=1 Tax=Streptomyces sp. NPDC051577 TaxID=3155166 RepID=UPI00341E800C
MRTERPQVKQERAVRTRLAILQAAATVFEEHGYEAAKLSDIVNIAKVTKGALYFHFDSKDDLAQAVVNAQNQGQPRALPQSHKVQEFIDIGMIFSHQLRHDVLMRASARLTLDRPGRELDQAAPYTAWIELHTDVLVEAKRRGELLPDVDPVVPSRLIVGAYAGLNRMASTLGLDLDPQVSELYSHVLPSMVVPALAIRLDTAPGRGARALYGPHGRHECRVGCPTGLPTEVLTGVPTGIPAAVESEGHGEPVSA